MKNQKTTSDKNTKIYLDDKYDKNKLIITNNAD